MKIWKLATWRFNISKCLETTSFQYCTSVTNKMNKAALDHLFGRQIPTSMTEMVVTVFSTWFTATCVITMNWCHHTAQCSTVLRHKASYPGVVSGWNSSATESRVLSCQIWLWGVCCAAPLLNCSPLASVVRSVHFASVHGWKEMCTTNGWHTSRCFSNRYVQISLAVSLGSVLASFPMIYNISINLCHDIKNCITMKWTLFWMQCLDSL